MKRLIGIVGISVFILSCGVGLETPGLFERGPGGKGDGIDVAAWEKGGVVKYLSGGAHGVLKPTLDGREPIDEANRPYRLHPDLVGDYLKWDASVTEGEAEWDVFASNWWPQSRNGIAWRWVPGVEQNYENTTNPKDLSPAEKYDLLVYPGQTKTINEVTNWPWKEMKKPEAERTGKNVHPKVKVVGPTTTWELQNHGVYQSTMPDSWWGHCNGWASYATAEKLGAPECDIWVKKVGSEIVKCAEGEEGAVFFRMGDIEALMSELYFSDQATFSGRRCSTEPDEIEFDDDGRPTDQSCRDINPGTFHVAVTGLMATGAKPLTGGEEKVRQSFVIDHNYDYEVWNYPLKKFEIVSQEEITKAEAVQIVSGEQTGVYKHNENATRFVKVILNYWMISDGVSASQMLLQASERDVSPHEATMSYVLELNGAGEILGGEWTKAQQDYWVDSRKAHPDFLWKAVKVNGWSEGDDDLGGYDDNPNISYSSVKKLLELAKQCGGETPQPNNICEGQCGQKAQSFACYCDESCTQYQDCCKNDNGEKTNDRSLYVALVCS
ncbi:MAG: hypothetical protein V1754_05335 [Pseudomonadota bacterium]